MNRFALASVAVEEIDSQFAWRQKEIIDIERATRNPTVLPAATLVRAGIALTYAHWEGFIKRTTEVLIDHVAAQRLPFERLTRPYWVLGAKGKLTQLRDGNTRVAMDVLEHLLSMSTRHPRFKGHDHVDTHSNLTSAVFTRIAMSVGIDTAPFELHFKLIDFRLVKDRNSVAHGDNLQTDAKGFSGMTSDVLWLMRTYMGEVQNIIANKSYLIR